MSTIHPPATDVRIAPGTVFAQQDSPSITSFMAALGEAMTAWVRSQGGLSAVPVLNGVSATIVNLDYTHVQKTDEEPVAIGEFTYVNDTSATQSATWQEQRVTTTTATVSITEALEVGANASFGIPDIGLGIGIDVKASVSTTHSQTLTTQQTWSWTVPVQVPGNTTVTGQALLTEVEYDLEFTADVRIDGGPQSCLALVFAGKMINLFANSPGGWFTVSPVPGFTPDGTAVLFRVRGVMKDVQGTGIKIHLTQHANSGGVHTYTVENAHAIPRLIATHSAE